MSTRPPSDPPELPGFRHVEPLGTGGFADVYLYEQLGLGRKVAVKVLLRDLDADVQASFGVEASVMAQLSNHPSIVSIYQAGATPDGRQYLVMEYCPPPHLALRVRARPLTLSKALEVAVQLAGAVETAHRLGILHRDIKPANILFTEFGRAALTDFGISVTTAGARSGQGIGMSVPWAPPEQLSVGAPMGPSGDVYALAATVWTALCGRSPFAMPGAPNDAVAMAARVRAMPVPPTRRPDVPDSLERVLRTAMAKAPDQRYDTALGVARALQAVQAEMHLPVTTIDVLDEHVADVAPHDDGGGTRISGFVSIDPDAPPTATQSRWRIHPNPSSATTAAALPSGSAEPDTVVPGPTGPALSSYDAGVTVGRGATPPPPAPATSTPAPGAASRPPAAPAEERRSRPSAPVLVGGTVVAALVAVGIWLGVRAPDATKSNQPPDPGPSAMDPIVASVPTPVDVKVKARSDGSLEVTWKAPDAEPDDRYAVLPQDPDSPDNDLRAATLTDATSLVLDGEGKKCVTVRAIRDEQPSRPETACDLS